MECLNIKPAVIDPKLIQQCLEEEGFKGEAGRLARLEGIPWDIVSAIRFDFKNILRIDHLWVLPALTNLSLSNNYIEKIENLESLVNLVELNLSFNKISNIEHLDTLVNLETLLLYENLITRIENLANLKKLTVFNIGMNLITEQKQVQNLRQHKYLKSLNMKGNACAESDNFRIYVTVFLPQLQFYEYKRIREDERALGVEIYKTSLLRIIDDEAVERAAQIKLEEEQAEAESHAESFVEFFNTDHLFNQMFERDKEGKAFLSMGDEAMECYEEFRDSLLKVTMEIFETGQQQSELRKKEVASYMKRVKDGKSANQMESIAEMESFIKRKDEFLVNIEQLQEDLINKDISMEDYFIKTSDHRGEVENSIIPKVWKKLMGLEITLYEQLEEVNEIFVNTLTDMVSNFIETAQGGFVNIRLLAGIYMENISELANRYLTNSMISTHFIADKEMLPYITDKDTLSNALSTSHDVHMQIIDSREDRLINRATAWLDNLVKDLQNHEIRRNRSKILEIIHFLDTNKQQFIKAIRKEGFQTMGSDVYLG